MSRRPKKKRSQSSHKSPRLPQIIPIIKELSWSRGDMIAAIGIIIAIMSALLSVSIPEIRQLIGLDRPGLVSAKQSIYRLKEKYVGHILRKIGDTESASSSNISEEIIIYFDWESPGGDFAGYMADSSHTLYDFIGKITTDMHFSFQCSNSNRSFNGYIYRSDGHIKGTMSNGSSLTLVQFNESSAVPVTTSAPPTGVPVPPVADPTPISTPPLPPILTSTPPPASTPTPLLPTPTPPP